MTSLRFAFAAAFAAWIFSAAAAPAGELELVQTIVLKGKAGGLDHVALDAKRDRLFLANKANNTLDVVDLKAGKLLTQKTGQTGIQGIAYAPDLDKVFVGLGSGLCNVFDGDSYKILKTIKFKDDADNVRYQPNTQLVYVAHADKMLGVIDAKTYELKADVPLPDTAEGFEAEVKRPRLYVNSPGVSQVSVIDTEKNEVFKTFPTKMASGGHPLALDEAAHRLYVGCRKKAMVVVLDTESGKEVGGADIADGVDDLWLDTGRKRLFASCGDGQLVVLRVTDADHVESLEKIETPKGAKTCLYVAETGRLYLAVPRQEGKDGPEIRIYRVK
jgi:DNA-binding beta-propeller fold protein YncE